MSGNMLILFPFLVSSWKDLLSWAQSWTLTLFFKVYLIPRVKLTHNGNVLINVVLMCDSVATHCPYCSVLSDSLYPWNVACQGSCPWGFSAGKNTGVGHALLQLIFPNSGLNPSLHMAGRFLAVWPPWKPILYWLAKKFLRSFCKYRNSHFLPNPIHIIFHILSATWLCRGYWM